MYCLQQTAEQFIMERFYQFSKIFINELNEYAKASLPII